jgi:hypothetical protein
LEEARGVRPKYHQDPRTTRSATMPPRRISSMGLLLDGLGEECEEKAHADLFAHVGHPFRL